MARRKSSRKTRPHLVLGYLEGISSAVFSKFSKEITELVGQRQGVYALYKGDRLYYVGLATNLRRRVKQHLKDKHAGKWNKFSVYLVRKSDHIKELESLILRIADPAGNAVGGRLVHSRNLKPDFRQRMKKASDQEIDKLIGPGRRSTTPKGKAKRTSRKKASTRTQQQKQPALAPYVSGFFKLRGLSRGKVYEAWAHSDGMINFQGNKYDSPSGAGRAALGRRVNGWTFWKYKTGRSWEKLEGIKANPKRKS